MDPQVRDAVDPDGNQWIPSFVMQWILMESSGCLRVCRSASRWNPVDPLMQILMVCSDPLMRDAMDSNGI